MKRIYFDNSSTSFPKYPGVAKAMFDTMESGGFNINRGGYAEAYQLENVVYDTREMLCRLFNFDKPSNVIFTPGITYSINYMIRGLLKKGDHIITSSMEHNAVMRPLAELSGEGIEFSCAQCRKDGTLDPQKVEELIRPSTKAVVMLHASNVCGTMLPLEEVGKITKKHNIRFIVDSAQSAGVFPIDIQKMGIDALCFTGHKSLRGPQGIGGFLISDDMAKEIKPVITGGTGSYSHLETVPPSLPDRFESGTMNIPGIVGLHAALKYIEEHDMLSLQEEEIEIAKDFYDKVSCIPGVVLVGKNDFIDRAPIVSVDFKDRDNGEAAFRLESEYGIMTRCGLHCAPRAHKTLGTYPQGTVRFSFSTFNTKEEVDFAAKAIEEILK